MGVLDEFASDPVNQEKLSAFFAAEFKKNPGQFWKDYVQPNLPKTAELDLTGKVTLVWDMPTE